MNAFTKAIPAALLITFTWGIPSMNAQAEEVPKKGPIPFATYDKDGDGLISEEEFNAVREERKAARAAEGKPMYKAYKAPGFSEFDANGDGQLTPEELAAGQQAQREKRLSEKKEYHGKKKHKPSFSDYDLNNDGKIIESEFNEAREKRMSEKAKEGYPMKKYGKAYSFSDIDTNKDGEISPAEFTEHKVQCRQREKQ